MSETFLQPISIPAIGGDPGDFGLIRAHVRLSGMGLSQSRSPHEVQRNAGKKLASAHCFPLLARGGRKFMFK